MPIYKRYKVRIYPTFKQKKMLDMHFNAYRFCYNLCLEYKSLMWKYYKINLRRYDMQAELYRILKETEFLSNCKVECLRESAGHVCRSFERFFSGNGYPKFKSKRDFNSFTAYQCIKVKKTGSLFFFGQHFRYRDSNKYSIAIETQKIRQITFKKNTDGEYYATCLLCVDRPNTINTASDSVVGIDLGLKDLIITSSGIKYSNNRYLKSASYKITKLQRRFSRTQKGSANRHKISEKIAKLYAYAVRQRRHYYHQITNELIRDNQTIVLETLKVKNLMKSHHFAKGIADASWGLIVKMLEYKGIWYSRDIIRLDRFYPSTKTCSRCGSLKEVLLSERVYNCDCGLSLDRDVNAAINIRNSGLKISGVLMEGVGYEPGEVRSNSLIINN